MYQSINKHSLSLNTPMNNSVIDLSKPLLSLLFLLMISTIDSSAQTITKFSVYVESALLNDGADVIVLGDHESLGKWANRQALVLSPTAEDPNIFEGYTTINSNAEFIEYKYVISDESGLKWERSRLGNRRFVLDSDTLELPLALFDEQVGSGVQTTFFEWTVTLDLSDFYTPDEYLEKVAIMGGREPLSFNLESERTEMQRVRPGVWSVKISFPFGTPSDIPFKFAWFNGVEWEWEWLPGHKTHVDWLNPRSQRQRANLKYDAELGIISTAANSNPNSLVDNFGAILEQQGKYSTFSRYNYEKALELLENGNHTEAERVYSNFGRRYAAGDETNDFYFRFAEHLFSEGKVTGAIEMMDREIENERIKNRRELQQYHKAELLILNGYHEDARNYLSDIEPLLENRQYKRFVKEGLAYSYLQDDNDSIAYKGLDILKNIVEDSSASNRGALIQLRYAYKRFSDTKNERNILQNLTRIGSPNQRAASQIELARFESSQGNKEKALTMVLSLNDSLLSKRDVVRLMVERIELHSQLGNEEEVINEVNSFFEKWPNERNGVGRRLEALKENVLANRERRELREQLRQNAADSTNSNGVDQ